MTDNHYFINAAHSSFPSSVLCHSWHPSLCLLFFSPSFRLLRSWYQQTSNLGSKCIHRSDIIHCFKLWDYLFFFPPSVCSSSVISSVTAPDEGWNITALVVQLHQIQNMLILQLKSWEKVLWPNFTRKIVVSAFHVMFQEGTLLALPVSLTGAADVLVNQSKKYGIQNITICLLCCSDITYSILFEAVTTLLVFFSYQLFHKDILRDGLIYQHIMKGRWWENTHRQVCCCFWILGAPAYFPQPIRGCS